MSDWRTEEKPIYDVPVGIVAEIDAAKARLAGALSREARP